MSKKNKNRQFKAVFFDVDGTVALSEPRNRDVIEKLAAKHGGEIRKEHWGFLAGQSETKIWSWLDETYEEFKGISQKDFSTQCRKGYLKSDFNVAARPGIHNIIKHFKDAGLHVVAVSNSPRNLVEHSLKVTNCFDYMDHIITEDEVLAAGKTPKPAPDPYLMAAHLFDGVHPEDCLIFEDSGTGINSGVSAGSTVVQVVDEDGSAKDNAHYHSASRNDLISLSRKLVP
jgi:HAD superfamily hydrolase (TIGR01509 family)